MFYFLLWPNYLYNYILYIIQCLLFGFYLLFNDAVSVLVLDFVHEHAMYRFVHKLQLPPEPFTE